MTLSPDKHWFSENDLQHGSAFSLSIRRKVHEEQTACQHIEVFETEQWGHLMTIDGFTMLATRDNFLYHEMIAHPVLFTHPDPRRVLIIGGGDCGTLREVLRHPGIEAVHQIDIDERVTRAAERFFPELCASNSDPRALLQWCDGLTWIKDAAPGSYDIIIVDSTDPVGPAEGLFGTAFYADCIRALDDEGLLVHQSESPLLHLQLMAGMRRAMRDAGFSDLRTLQFPQPIYPSGWWSVTIAKKVGQFNGFREQDAANRPFETRYYSAQIHKGALALPPFMEKYFAEQGV